MPLRPACIALCIALAAHVGAAPVVPGFDRFADGGGPAGVSGGALLFNELQCGACHGPRASAFPPRTAPDLLGVAERIRPAYLEAFLAAPHDVKPGSTMPDLLSGHDAADRAAIAGDLAHFLRSLGGPFQADGAAPDQETLERGAHLFHSVGCAACHAPAQPPETGGGDDPFADSGLVELPPIELPSVPLPHLGRKTSAAALAAFLLDPAHARPGGRMPDMTLAEDEAAAIAHWLVNRSPAPPGGDDAPVDPARAERGRAHFESLGCAACHALDGVENRHAAPRLDGAANWTAGCLAEDPPAGAARFGLAENQRNALAALRDAPADEKVSTEAAINHTLVALNCYACHDRDGAGGPEPGRAAYFTETEALDLGDEGRLPPSLTGVGAKLTPGWLRDILTDAGRVRPYMATRMPHFPAEFVEPLAEALLEADRDPEPMEVDVSGLEHHHRNHYGRELMGVNGLGCVTCHDLNGHRSLGIPAVDLAHVPARLQPAWFLKYMLEPASLRPQTRMPDFFDGNKSLNSKLFGGDARKQIEALWIYLREVEETRLPEGMEDDTDYELRPTDRPLVHRTFIDGVGPNAIAVGFPGGLNFAWDARGARPAIAWRGRFIDAESAWADRYVPFVKPLGTDVVAFPAGAPLDRTLEGTWPDRSEEIRYRGYRLDSSRTPVFRYTLGEVHIEEALRPNEEGVGLVRRLTFTGPPQTIFLRLGIGDPVEGAGNTYKIGRVTLRVAEGPPGQPGPEEVGWVLPVAVTEAGATIEQVITW
ncbi:MAG: c-type cytochrome [Candidatus Hydrogenedentes bacterium]|nr:c-type cytochrome [Candidatus Hydrogenedentota bacterium]